jgi:hypothetical protein
MLIVLQPQGNPRRMPSKFPAEQSPEARTDLRAIRERVGLAAETARQPYGRYLQRLSDVPAAAPSRSGQIEAKIHAQTIGAFLSFSLEPRAIGNKAKFECICVVQQVHTSSDPAQSILARFCSEL